MRHNGSDSDVLGLGDDASVPDFMASDILRDFSLEVPLLDPGQVLVRTCVSTRRMSSLLFSRPRWCMPLPSPTFSSGEYAG